MALNKSTTAITGIVWQQCPELSCTPTIQSHSCICTLMSRETSALLPWLASHRPINLWLRGLLPTLHMTHCRLASLYCAKSCTAGRKGSGIRNCCRPCRRCWTHVLPQVAVLLDVPIGALPANGTSHCWCLSCCPATLLPAAHAGSTVSTAAPWPAAKTPGSAPAAAPSPAATAPPTGSSGAAGVPSVGTPLPVLGLAGSGPV